LWIALEFGSRMMKSRDASPPVGNFPEPRHFVYQNGDA
jgi:hypothetical protein